LQWVEEQTVNETPPPAFVEVGPAIELTAKADVAAASSAAQPSATVRKRSKLRQAVPESVLEVEPADEAIGAMETDVSLEEIPFVESVPDEPTVVAKRGLSGRDLALLGIGVGGLCLLALLGLILVLLLR
jgi:hypothetical protein